MPKTEILESNIVIMEGKGEMRMIYYTGDIHGNPALLVEMCRFYEMKATDTLVILGDVGVNYSLDVRDTLAKRILSSVAPTVLCIHGNHEVRPNNIKSYKQKEWNGGSVWFEDSFPHLLFAKDGEIFNIEGKKHLVIGGAYSVDKFYRIREGYGWWDDEQPSDEIKSYVEKQCLGKAFDVVLSHTCPLKYTPTEAFLPGLDQSLVDKSTEIWLDKIEENIDYKKWYCGHWHLEKKIDKLEFLYHNIAAQ